MHQVTIRFGDDLWGHLEVAAASSGLTVAQYVHEAAVERLAVDHLRPRGLGPGAAGGRRDGVGGGSPVPRPGDLGGPDETAAVRAQARQARLRATALRQEAARLRAGEGPELEDPSAPALLEDPSRTVDARPPVDADGPPAPPVGGTASPGARVVGPPTGRAPEDARRELDDAHRALRPMIAELEATTDELQATNAELVATSSDLRDMGLLQAEQVRALDGAQAFLEGVLHSLGTGVAVVDHDGRITMWNSRSEELWGLRPDEVAGRSLLALDVRSPADPLARALQRAVTVGGEGSDVTLEAVDRRGRAFSCELLVLPLSTSPDAVHGALVLMTERRGPAPAADLPEGG